MKRRLPLWWWTATTSTVAAILVCVAILVGSALTAPRTQADSQGMTYQQAERLIRALEAQARATERLARCK